MRQLLEKIKQRLKKLIQLDQFFLAKARRLLDFLKGWTQAQLNKWLNINRLTIASQLYLGIGFVVAMTLATSIISWLLFGRIGSAQSYINERSIPQLIAAFGIAQRSATLVNAAPRLVTATNEKELNQVAIAIKEQQVLFADQLTRLLETNIAQTHGQARLERMRRTGDTLVQNIENIKETVAAHLSLNKTKALMRAELLALQYSITKTLVPEIDNQLYYTVTGYRNLGEERAPASEYKSDAALLHYRNLADLQELAIIGTTVLSHAFDIESVPLLEPQRERFEAIAGNIEHKQSSLTDVYISEAIASSLARFFEMGYGEGNVFAVRRQDIELTEKQRSLLSRNRQLALNLVSQTEGVAKEVRAGAAEANLVSEEAVALGTTALIALSIISVVSAFLVGWLFVGRFLVRRLEWLAARMRQMAEGDLSGQVSMAGHDEVADMATALEVFRKSSLEAQRVDVAERLASELSEKNDQLESVLGDLKRAQTQIVMREKLAALGELTAGVAHEIKNPLNFIKNFSEMTGELVEELKEVLKESKTKFSKKSKDLIEELTEELKGNAERVKNHSERANRIVHDMLSMGRGGGERQMSNINTLLDEHVRLSFHSARAADSEFQLHIVQELDPDIGEVEVIPQDLGRLFLNLVTNACYATNKRRRDILKEAASKDAKNQSQADAQASPYMPTLTVLSKKFGEDFQVVVRDNGCGISEENIKKIFNPFFTTKPTDQGTGLGLALSSDIIRAHGGSMDVQSKINEFTEMTITIPFKQPVGTDAPESSELDEAQADEQKQKGAA